MPSLRQFYELKNNCATKWTNVNGMGGYLFKSNTNGKAVFLPAAGWLYNGVQDVGSDGRYWSCMYDFDIRPDLGYILGKRSSCVCWTRVDSSKVLSIEENTIV